MHDFKRCENCGNRVQGKRKYCCIPCCEESHMNRRMSERALAVLMLLGEQRGWVRMGYHVTVKGLSVKRYAPLIAVRNVRGANCEACITPVGDKWLKYHIELQEAA
jgi:hypothetical protein